jgi:hypothetical protein
MQVLQFTCELVFLDQRYRPIRVPERAKQVMQRMQQQDSSSGGGTARQ